MLDTEIVTRLGGFEEVWEYLRRNGFPDLSRETARHFESSKIPWKYRPAIKRLAGRRQIKLPADFLEKQRSV